MTNQSTTRNKHWTPEEEEYLMSNIGVFTINNLAKRLNRTPSAVLNKSKRLGVENTKNEYGITASKLASLLKVDRRIVLNWIELYDLPHRRQVTKNVRSFIFINPAAFWEWAENNKHRINFSKIPVKVILPEPKWVDVERRNDYYNGKSKMQNRKEWTTHEIIQLNQLRDKGLTYEQISVILDRSIHSVSHKYRSISNQHEFQSE